jgi:hypothetical protein
VAGELNAAEQAGQGAGTVLDGDLNTLVGGQVTVADKLIEPAGRAGGGGQLGGIGEQLTGCSDRLSVGCAVDGLS